MKTFFNKERGITDQTLEAFGVKFPSDSEAVFPYGKGYKSRVHKPDGTRQFFWTKGTSPQLFVAPVEADNSTHAFLVEGESDAMRLWQELGQEHRTPVFGLPGIETWNDAMADQLTDYEKVWTVLDNDPGYGVTARVDNAWRNIRFDLGTRARRLRLPKETKDICEFFDQFDLDALKLIMESTPLAKSRFKPLDLTAEPPAVQWVLESMICKGDIHLLIGEPGIGKSWLTMGLTVAVAGESETFLNHRIMEHGRVFYLDEENPPDLIYNRFTKLGMTQEAAKNIRYINNFGIRLDKGDADSVIEEALDFEPTLIVLDSLTRFHTEDENHAGAMAGLFHRAIKPLARESGAAVVLIHHAGKSDSNSSYRRSRGSGDITASVDCGYDVREIGEGTLAIANFKSRRQAQGDTLYASITDTSEGSTQIVGGDVPELPF
jgi:hypothetical protein